jgi:hypothetical protein
MKEFGMGDENKTAETSLRGRPLAKFAVVRDAQFAARLAQAADEARIPGLNQGRLTTIKALLMSRHSIDVALESVRKWVAGESKPRADKMTALASVLSVDEGWLALGREPEMTPKDRQLRRRVSSGAVHVLAGYVLMSGGNAIYPEDRDPRSGIVDLYVIMDNRQIPVHVTTPRMQDDQMLCALPRDYHLVETVVAVKTGPFEMDFLMLRESDIRAESRPVEGHYEVTLTKDRSAYRIGKRQLEKIKAPADLAS